MYENILLGFEFEVETYSRDDVYDFIDEVSHITGYNDHHVHNYHSSMNRTIVGKWRVENDDSILGAEFISPPIYYNEARKMVKEFFRVIEKSDNAMITDNCGLHVGLSINGTVEGLDLSSFLVSLDQRFIASLWPERIKSRYVRNIGEQIKRFKCFNNINIDNFASHLFHSFHTFISLKTFNNKKYLELRIPGGKDYHHKFKELFTLIDYVADKVLSSHPLYNPIHLSRIDNKKCTKKIASYVNRTLKQDSDILNFDTANKKFGYKKLISISVMSSILDLTLAQIEYICNNDTQSWDTLNEDCFLYNLIKYCIIHRKEYTEYRVDYLTKKFLSLVKKLAPYVNIPKKESTYNKVKIFKEWNRLPTHMIIDLLSSINSRHAHSYLIRHVKGGILHAIVTDSKGVLKNHAITYACKHNKVK